MLHSRKTTHRNIEHNTQHCPPHTHNHSTLVVAHQRNTPHCCAVTPAHTVHIALLSQVYILWLPTLILAALARLFSLSVPVSFTGMQMSTPFFLLLLLPFVRAGEWLGGNEPVVIQTQIDAMRNDTLSVKASSKLKRNTMRAQTPRATPRVI